MAILSVSRLTFVFVFILAYSKNAFDSSEYATLLDVCVNTRLIL